MINNTVQFNSRPLSASFLQAASKYKPGPGTLDFGQQTTSQSTPQTTTPIAQSGAQAAPSQPIKGLLTPTQLSSQLSSAKQALMGLQDHLNAMNTSTAPQNTSNASSNTVHVSQGTRDNPSSGFPSYVAQTAQASNPNQTQTGLISNLQNTAQGNQEYAQRAQEIANQYAPQIQKIGFLGAGAQAGDLSTGSNVVGSGNAAIASQSASQRAQALIDAENAALAGNAQGLTAQQQQANALNQALGGANTQQAQQIGGLGTAAGFAQPSTAAYGQTVFNPLTGQYQGGGGNLDPQAQSQNLAQQVLNGSITYDQAISSLGYAGNIGTTLLNNAITASGGNPLQLQAQGAAQQQNIGTAATQTAGQGAQLQKAGAYALQTLQDLQNTYNQLGGVQKTGVPLLNQISNVASRELGLGAQGTQQYNTSLQEARAAVSNALSAAGNTPTFSDATASALLPDNASPQQIAGAVAQIQTLMQQKIGTYNTTSNPVGTPQQNNQQGTIVQTSAGAINTNW